MYRSPIELIIDEIKYNYDNDIMQAIQNVGINVSKEELIKALDYDRNQYDKGYNDCKSQYEQALDKACEFLEKFDEDDCAFMQFEERPMNKEQWKEYLMNEKP